MTVGRPATGRRTHGSGTMEVVANDGVTAAPGPRCPSCTAPLAGNLRSEQVLIADAAPSRALLLYCGACGATLSAQRVPQVRSFAGGQFPAVADPDDPASLAGQFQLRCRELIAEIQAMGFGPGGWIGLINDYGAVDAARELIRENRILPVTRWLIARGRPELTMEHEMSSARWTELFSDDERSEAARRIDE